MSYRGWSFLISCCAIATFVTANALADDKLAPADEYFGPTKMSPLEVTNRINDAERTGANYDGLMNTQSAVEDWAEKYPNDPWIAPREIRLFKLFSALHSDEGDIEADHCRQFIHEHFPQVEYGILATDSGSPQ
jgi:hypothetical protein